MSISDFYPVIDTVPASMLKPLGESYFQIKIDGDEFFVGMADAGNVRGPVFVFIEKYEAYIAFGGIKAFRRFLELKEKTGASNREVFDVVTNIHDQRLKKLIDEGVDPETALNTFTKMKPISTYKYRLRKDRLMEPKKYIDGDSECWRFAFIGDFLDWNDTQIDWSKIKIHQAVDGTICIYKDNVLFLFDPDTPKTYIRVDSEEPDVMEMFLSLKKFTRASNNDVLWLLENWDNEELINLVIEEGVDASYAIECVLL